MDNKDAVETKKTTQDECYQNYINNGEKDYRCDVNKGLSRRMFRVATFLYESIRHK